MPRGPLYQESYRPQLSGHETFPLRYGWLKKAFDAVHAGEAVENHRSVFSSDDAIARFGVGKNMVASIRHWATATGVIRDASRKPQTTNLGRLLFSECGLDPYMENPATAWLIHWQLCGNPNKTTWFWTFNHFPAPFFERDLLVRSIEKLPNECGWKRVSPATIRKDVACFVRTYVSQPPTGKASREDTLESPLTELGLIRPIGKRDGFRFVRGPKPSLGQGVFCHAVTEFWLGHLPNARTLSFEALAHEPGSPGRVFLLDENDLVDRLTNLEDVSDGLYRWSETTGLKQLIRNRDLDRKLAVGFIKFDYDGKLTEKEMS